MSSSLSTVVSGLVRAQMGSSLSPTVTDEDLDKAVAELILKEAKKKTEAYKSTGLKAYLRNNFFDSNAPRANKRFLSSIIKNTDEHNKSVLRSQAEAAYEVKKARDDAERSERRRRAEEAVDAEYSRRHGHSHRRRDREQRRRRKHRNDYEEDIDEDDHGLRWDRWDGRTASRKRKTRDWETWDGSDPVTSEDEALPSEERRSSRHKKRSSHREGKRRRSYSRSPTPSNRSGSQLPADKEELRRAPRSKRRSSDKSSRSKHRSPSPWSKRLKAAASYDPTKPTPSTSTSSDLPHSHYRIPSPGPEPLPYVPSKMDRYFDEDYDPRLDVDPLAVPIIPATGLISDADFAGWDAMLDALRAREDRKRARAAGLSADSIGTSSSCVNEQKGLMDMKYAKRGAVREWDLGKETPT